MHTMHVDLDQLRALDALVRLRSVTAAGRAIGLTQSATSHALGRLRAAFGDALLVRTREGMVPTAMAEELAERARRILADVERLAGSRAVFDPRTARQTFTLAMSDGGQLLVLGPLLDRLAREAPGVTIAVRPGGGDTAHLLETGEVALALGGAARAGGSLYQQVLIEDELVWVVRKAARTPTQLSLDAYVARGRVRIARPGSAGPRSTPAGSAESIARVDRPGGEPLLDRALAHAKLPAPATVTVHTLLAALLVVLRTDRVLTMSAQVAHALARVMPIRALPPATPLGTVAIAQRWHARFHADPGHAWLRQQLKQIVDRRAWI
jgi:DNA-binding transcriptional LysR family regulator